MRSTAQYTYGRLRISQNRGGVVSYYGYDAGASVRELFSDTGAITDTYDYDAFGNTVARTGSTVNEFLYRGEQFDSVLGIYYLRARYYNSGTGRFLTVDPLEGSPSDPTTLHKYLYAGGDPVNRIDPRGRENIEDESNLIGEDVFAQQQVKQGADRLYKALEKVKDFAECIKLLVEAFSAGGTVSAASVIEQAEEACRDLWEDWGWELP